MKRIFAIMVALVALVAFTAPAWASDDGPGPSFIVGGRMLTDLGYNTWSKELTTNKKDDVTTAFVSLGNTSYLRGTFASVDKTTGGVVELGLASSLPGGTAVSLRYAYGWWKVGNCKLYAGQTDNWTGSSTFDPMQYFGQTDYGHNSMQNWGHIYGGRAPQAGFQWETDMFGFQVALVQPDFQTSIGAAPAAAPAAGSPNPSFYLPKGSDLYMDIPRLDLALKFNVGGLLIQPGFGFSQIKFDGVAGSADDTINSWIAILPVKFTAGMFTFKGEIHYGVNADTDWNGGRSASINKVLNDLPVIQANGKVQDTHQTGGFGAVEFKVMPAWTITGGAGLEALQNDGWSSKSGLAYKNDNYTRWQGFVAFPYEVTKNFTIHPELDYFNYGTNPATNSDYGTEWLAGIQFRFVF